MRRIALRLQQLPALRRSGPRQGGGAPPVLWAEQMQVKSRAGISGQNNPNDLQKTTFAVKTPAKYEIWGKDNHYSML